MDCKERMEAYLRENGVSFEVKRHSTAYTMPEVAAALHEPGKHVAKVVMVKAGDRMAMLVVPSPYRLNMDQVRELLGVKKARLAHEHEFGDTPTPISPLSIPSSLLSSRTALCGMSTPFSSGVLQSNTAVLIAIRWPSVDTMRRVFSAEDSR